jgi:hypothetical protein
MRAVSVFGIIALAGGALLAENAASEGQVLVVTSSNAANNQLLVYDTAGNLVQSASTKGQGGAGGNSGGIAEHSGLLAVVNFGSQTVALFGRTEHGFQFRESIPTASNPLSVAFGNNHLYVLGTTTAESHKIFGSFVSPGADGVVKLLKADGSSAQIGVVGNQLIITEKSNVIENASLGADGAITGNATLVQNIPANVDAPFGLVTRGDDAYVTIAHADEISLVRNGHVLATTPTSSFPGPVQHAPCWLTLVGPFLYSSNSPSMTVSRYAVYGQKIVPDAAVAASFSAPPTDMASRERLVAVIDGSGSSSRLSVFKVDEDGNLALQAVTSIASPANGVVIVGKDTSEEN